MFYGVQNVPNVKLLLVDSYVGAALTKIRID